MALSPEMRQLLENARANFDERAAVDADPKALLLEIAEDLPGASEAEIFAQFEHEILSSTVSTELMDAIIKQEFDRMMREIAQ